MTSEYKTESTSVQSADVDDISLRGEEGDKVANTRRALRTKIVAKTRFAPASVHLKIIHQRRKRSTEPWVDCDNLNLATLKAGQAVNLDFSSAETTKLFNHLANLYAIASEEGIPFDKRKFVVSDADEVLLVEGDKRKVVEKLLALGTAEFWKLLDELEPESFQAIAHQKINDAREKEVAEFEKQMTAGTWIEPQWQSFFEKNTWIFGQGLAYQILKVVESQPAYGGVAVDRKGGQRGDFLMATEAARRFTVLVDIKRPDTPLIDSDPYRSRVYRPSTELMGGMAQLQSNCNTWNVDGSRQQNTAERLRDENIYNYEPRAILLIGNTRSLDIRDKIASFELFRRNLRAPDVITFDELLERAKFIIGNSQNLSSAAKAA